MAEKQVFSFEGLKNAGRMHVRVLDEHSGLKEYKKVYAVRMKDRDVHHLFMNDYNPTLGRVIGDVTVLNPDGEHTFNDIEGFYKLQHNEFTLLIQSQADAKAVKR